MKVIGRKSTALLGLSLALAAAGCGGGGGEDLGAGVAAKVGDKTISEAAVRSQLDSYYALQEGSAKSFGPPRYTACVAAKRGVVPGATEQEILGQCRVEFDLARAQALSTILRADWLAREAKRKGIDSDAEVEQALERNKILAMALKGRKPRPHNREVQPLIEERPGLSHKDLVATVRAATLQNKLMAAIPVTEIAIAEYADANADTFRDSETRVVRVVQTLGRARALRARRELHHNANWSKMTKRYTVEQYAQHWWTGTQTVTEGTAPEDAFGRALFNARRGEIVGPVRTLNGYFVFQVKAIHPPRHRKLTPRARATVSTTIRSKRLEQLLHDHYAAQTSCAAQYQIPEAPQCL